MEANWHDGWRVFVYTIMHLSASEIYQLAGLSGSPQSRLGAIPQHYNGDKALFICTCACLERTISNSTLRRHYMHSARQCTSMYARYHKIRGPVGCCHLAVATNCKMKDCSTSLFFPSYISIHRATDISRRRGLERVMSHFRPHTILFCVLYS